MKLRQRLPARLERSTKERADRVPNQASATGAERSGEPSASEVFGNQAFVGSVAAPIAAKAPSTDAGVVARNASFAESLRTGWLTEETKPEFLERLRTQVHATAADALAGTGFTPSNCPWIEYWFAYYAGRSAGQIEHAAARFAPETRAASDMTEIIPLIAARIRRGVEQWALTGELSGVPGEVPVRIPGRPAPSGVFFAGHVSGVTADIDPRLLRLRLGAGQPLPAPVRSRMESVFRLRFPKVLIHTDATADALARRLDARAFAVGQNIAFRAGEYRPGTPIGDALLAHELAHTVQQREAAVPSRPSLAAEA
ncbi:MAG: DUF4157 domain-containing protein, partial [Bryobacteraceae bacterium]